MRRSLRVALGVVVVALAVPTVALATHHGDRGLSHGGRHGHRHHGGRGGGGGPAPTTTTGATGGAGTVESYSNGMLKIGLAGGGTITGSVTDGTRFECHHSQSDNGGARRRTVLLGDSGPSGPSGPSGDSGPSGPSGPSGDSGASGTPGYGDHGRGHGHDHGHGGSSGPPRPPCDSSLLVGGAEVVSAQVELTANGVVFDGVGLLPAVQ